MALFSSGPLPPDYAAIPSKWAYKIKRDEHERLDRFKARVVAQGFRQVAGRDYDEVYAPLSKYATFRTMLSTVVEEDLELVHMDVHTAFLNGELENVVYVLLSPGYEANGKVWRLHKALYGPKQSARAWYSKLKSEPKQMGRTVTYSDESLYIEIEDQDDAKEKVFLLVYIDDLLIAGSYKSVARLRKLLNEKFKIHDLEDIKHFLGIEVLRNHTHGKLWIGQQRHANNIN
jgi:hypothetical protein